MAGRKRPKQHRTPDVLLIENDEMNIRLFRTLLESRGYRVHCFTSGNAAIAALDILRPHLIVLDIVIPGMSGLDVLKALKQSNTHHDFPVVVVSALPPAHYRQASMDAGCDAFIAKPISVNTFLSTVAYLLSVHRIASANPAKLAKYIGTPPPAAAQVPAHVPEDEAADRNRASGESASVRSPRYLDAGVEG